MIHVFLGISVIQEICALFQWLLTELERLTTLVAQQFSRIYSALTDLNIDIRNTPFVSASQ
jgi:hypothetical protein